MTPELGLAIDTVVTESGALILAIYKKAKECRNFRDRCTSLANDAALLLKIVERNKSAVDSFETLAALQACLNDIDGFVKAAENWSKVKVAQEVLFRKRFPALKQRVLALISKFSFEVGVETLAQQKAEFEANDKKQSDFISWQRGTRGLLTDIKKILDEERRRAEKPLAFNPAPALKADIDADHLENLVFKDETDMVGRTSPVGRGALKGMGQVVCTIIEPADYTAQYLELYRNIQAGASVQRCHGVLFANEHYFAVMDSIDGLPTLNKLCEDGTVAKLHQIEKLAIAYELSKSVAWFHTAEILLKSLSDHTVVVKKLASGEFQPVLVGLERSRMFLMRTSNIQYDSRYQAPELRSARGHTPFSDIWSLGLVLSQVATGYFPYDESKFIIPGSDADKMFQTKVQEAVLPCNTDIGTELPGYKEIIQMCLRRRGDLRPTAVDVARTLEQLYTRMSCAMTISSRKENSSREVLEDIQSKIMRDVIRVREKNPPGTTQFTMIQNIQTSQQEFEAYYCDAEWDSVKSFVIGAAVYWKLVDMPTDDDTVGDATTPQQAVSDEIGMSKPTTFVTSVNDIILVALESRNFFSLRHLNAAAQGGYNEAFHEIWRAQAALARFYKAKHARLCPAGPETALSTQSTE